MLMANLWTCSDLTCKWFDGYAGHEDCLFDDVDHENKPSRSWFLRLFDRYAVSVPVKGGFVNWKPKRVIVTSNFHYAELYHRDEAVKRRVDEYILF